MSNARCRFDRFALAFFAASTLVLAPACGGGGDGTAPPAVAASFNGSGTAAAPNKVRLKSQSMTGNLVVLQVAIGGPATSTDLYSFAFDLVLSDPTVAMFVAGTDEFGDALTLVGTQTGETLATQQGNRVVVGASKAGGGLGNQVTVPEAVIMRLTFKVLKVGTTNLTFSGGPAALDSVGTTIPSVQFDALAAVLTGT